MSEGRLAENVMHFARLLRAAGLRIGSDRVIDCVRALEITGANHAVMRRDDWYWTMSAVLLSRQEQRPIFDQAFQIFWRDPKLTERMMQMLLPQAYGRAAKPEQQQSQRLTDALFSQQREAREKQAERLDIEARLTFSSREVLQRIQQIKEQIDQTKVEIEQAQREYDYNKAAELQYGKLAQLEQQLNETEAQLKASGATLLKQEVDEQDVAEVVANVWPMIADGQVRPIIGAEFPIEQARAAHELLASGEVSGKVLLRVAD